jgi:hypothetical protein
VVILFIYQHLLMEEVVVEEHQQQVQTQYKVVQVVLEVMV